MWCAGFDATSSQARSPSLAASWAPGTATSQPRWMLTPAAGAHTARSARMGLFLSLLLLQGKIKRNFLIFLLLLFKYSKQYVFTKNATSHATQIISPPQVYSERLIPDSVRKKIFKKWMEAEAAQTGQWETGQKTGRGEEKEKATLQKSSLPLQGRTSGCHLSR